MLKLNLPEFSFRTRNVEGRNEIFDNIRKKYVVLTPEEWVRQNFVQYLICFKNVPATLVIIEKGLKLYKLHKRSDIVVFNRNANPLMVVECKAPDVKITQNAFDQVARYNIVLKVKFLVVTNGFEHYCCRIDHKKKKYHFLDDIPDFENMILDGLEDKPLD